MAAVDEDLRHGRPAVREAEHLFAGARRAVDVGFLILHALVLEQPLGTGAIGAAELGVDLDADHLFSRSSDCRAAVRRARRLVNALTPSTHAAAICSPRGAKRR